MRVLMFCSVVSCEVGKMTFSGWESDEFVYFYSEAAFFQERLKSYGWALKGTCRREKREGHRVEVVFTSFPSVGSIFQGFEEVTMELKTEN